MPTFLLVIFYIKIFLANVAQFQDISVFLEAVLSRKRKRMSWSKPFKDDHAFEEFEVENEFDRVRKFVRLIFI